MYIHILVEDQPHAATSQLDLSRDSLTGTIKKFWDSSKNAVDEPLEEEAVEWLTAFGAPQLEDDTFGSHDLAQLLLEIQMRLYQEMLGAPSDNALLHMVTPGDTGQDIIMVQKDGSICLAAGSKLPSCSASVTMHFCGRVTTVPSAKSLPLANVANHLWYVEPDCTNFASELCSPAWLVTSGVQEDDTKQIATMKMQQKSVKFNLTCRKKPITLTVHDLELDMDAIGRFCKKDAEGHIPVRTQITSVQTRFQSN